MVPEKGNLDGNHAKLMNALRELEEQPVDVVITPECFLDGYLAPEEWVNSDNIGDYGIDPADSPYTREIAWWAAEHSTWIIYGCTRRSLVGAYNTALIFDRQGNLHGHYDKTHLQEHDRKYAPGLKLCAFDADFGVFGVLICADRRWPETVRTLALQGARVIFNPTYGMHDEVNLRMMQTRSYESEIFIAFTHPRQSLCTGPDGRIVLDESGEESWFSICEIDLTEVDNIRNGTSHLRDRKPELYTGWAEER